MFKRGPRWESNTEHTRPPIRRPIADAATMDLPIVRVDTPAEVVLERLLESDRRRVAVVNHDAKVVGFVTERDFLARCGEARPSPMHMLRAARLRRFPVVASRPLTAADVMVRSLVTLKPGGSLLHALWLIVMRQAKRLIR